MALRGINYKRKILYVTNNMVINSFKQFSKSKTNLKTKKSEEYEYQKLKPPIVYNTKVTRFENGFRVATEDIAKPICTIGLWIETGSRWESGTSNGIAHFHQRMILKGIPDFETKLNNLGTQLSSYTTREVTGYYATCLPDQIPAMIEILSEIINYTEFDESVIDSEREETLQQMKDNDNNYNKVVIDFLHSTAFQGTQLGQSTYGPTKNVKKFTHKDINEYITKNYKASRMVLSAVGLICHDELCDVAKDFFGTLETVKCYLDPSRFTGSEIRYRDDSIPKTYAAIALEGCPLNDPDFYPLTVAAAIIGTYDREPYAINHPGKLIRACAEDSLCHRFRSFHTNYSDTGLWGIYFECDPLKAENMIFNIQSEWMKLCTMVTKDEVERGKSRLKTYIGRHITGTEQTCIAMGNQLMYSINSMEIQQKFRHIDDVTKACVQDVCMRYIYDRCPAVAAVGPLEAFPDYLRVRSGMYWLRY